MTAGRRGREDQRAAVLRAQAKGGGLLWYSPQQGASEGAAGGSGGPEGGAEHDRVVEKRELSLLNASRSSGDGDGEGHGEWWLSLGVLGSPERRAGDGTFWRKVGRVRRLLPLGRCSGPPDLEEDVLWPPLHTPCLLVRSLSISGPLPTAFLPSQLCFLRTRGAAHGHVHGRCFRRGSHPCIRSTSRSKPPPPWRLGSVFLWIPGSGTLDLQTHWVSQ